MHHVGFTILTHSYAVPTAKAAGRCMCMSTVTLMRTADCESLFTFLTTNITMHNPKKLRILATNFSSILKKCRINVTWWAVANQFRNGRCFALCTAPCNYTEGQTASLGTTNWRYLNAQHLGYRQNKILTDKSKKEKNMRKFNFFVQHAAWFLRSKSLFIIWQ
jgi:hypothetical protein